MRPVNSARAATITLSLVSHTNVGKTTLARTLLGRDIGEVRDQAHVTEQAESHTLIESPAGDRLLLADTPGFGDSQRLARRLAQAGNPLGWFLGQVWDRWRDRPFWASQRALRQVLAEADVVLYLVNAAESPGDVGYLDAELQVLALIGKPVIALLNQTGPAGAQAAPALEAAAADSRAAAGLDTANREAANPDAATPEAANPEAASHEAGADTDNDMDTGVGTPADSARDSTLDALLAAWRARLAGAPCVRAVLPLDAFTRCWVQEGALWQAVAAVLAAPQQPAFQRLRAAWVQRQQAQWQAAMAELARRLARAALDREQVIADGWRGSLRNLGQTLGRGLGRLIGVAPVIAAGTAPGAAVGAASGTSGTQRAMAALAARLDADLRQSTETLIRLHGLDGRAGSAVMSKLARHYAVRAPLDEGQAAVWGGVVTGALAGLKADIASGGLTLGGGLLVGGVLGALGAAGAVRGVNKIRGLEHPQVAWDSAVLDALLAAALLGYLAVAHHGRGRGDWVADTAQTQPPPLWSHAVAAVLAERRDAVDALWRQRQVLLGTEVLDAPASGALQAPLAALLHGASAALLARLYPQAEGSAPA